MIKRLIRTLALLSICAALSGRAGTIRGTVRNAANGLSLQGIDVKAEIKNADGGWVVVGATWTAEDGTYEIGALPEDVYRVLFARWHYDYVFQTFNGHDGVLPRSIIDWHEADNILVRLDETVSGIDAALTVGGRIAGTVTDANSSQPLQTIEVLAYFEKANGGWDWTGRRLTATDGTYQIGGLPDGTYRVSFAENDGRYGVQTYNGQNGVLPWNGGDAVSVALGSTVHNINAALVLADPLPPPPPTNLAATPGVNQVALQWTASVGGQVAGYRVFWGTAPGVYGNDINVGNVTTYSVTGLSANTPYYVAVRAYDGADNLGSFSTEVSATPQTGDGLFPVYRFWSDSLMSHFFTISASERNNVIATWPDVWTYEGIAFYVHQQSVADSLPVHRFWSDVIGCHIFTISEVEKMQIESRWSKAFQYEGHAWYAFDHQAPGTLPVYRFWAPRLRKPFFTISEAEKDNVIATMSHTWSYQGVAWYAYTSPSAVPAGIASQSGHGESTTVQAVVSDAGQSGQGDSVIPDMESLVEMPINGETPSEVFFSLSYGSDTIVAAMLYDPVTTEMLRVLPATLSPSGIIVPALPFDQRYWMAMLTRHIDDADWTLAYGGWLGRIADEPAADIATIESDGLSEIGLPLESIVLPDTEDTLTLRLYSRDEDRVIQTLTGLVGGETYDLIVPEWNRWYRVEIENEADGVLVQTLWIGHLRTH